MGATRTIWLPIPRVISATVRRCASAERLATYDMLPLVIPDLGASEAPVAIRTFILVPDVGDEVLNETMDELREHGGHLFDETGLKTPEDLSRKLERRMRSFQEAFQMERGRTVLDLVPIWSGVSTGRGIRPEAEHRIATVHDDGRAAQESVRASLEASLVLVDGKPHHRIEPLFVEVLFEKDSLVVNEGKGGYVVDLEPRRVRHDRIDSSRTTKPWLRFPIHRADEAMAFIRDTLDVEPATISKFCSMTQYEVMDREAYERSDAFSDARLVRDCAKAFAELVAPAVAHQDDAVLSRFAEVRRADTPDDDLRDAMLDLARRMRTAPRAPWMGGRDHADLVREATCLVDRFERREMRHEHDVDALSALSIA